MPSAPTTVYRNDGRSYGISGADETSPSLEAAVKELSAVMGASGLPRAALLGIASGAAPSIAYSARNPDRVSHLVMLGGYSHGLLHRQPSADHLAYIEAPAPSSAWVGARAMRRCSSFSAPP
jgi:pimeloyl-ACP methyl ester carboxylesterase